MTQKAISPTFMKLRSGFPALFLAPLFALALALSSSAGTASEEKRIAFLGDSNTDWATFPVIIRHFMESRGENVSIVNAGLAGDVASNAIYRMDEEIFSKGPIHAIFVAFGINDIDWGND